MSEGTPLFTSVVVPARNAEHLFPRVLGALLASDLPRQRWELIVVDDGSTDDTAGVAARFADTVVKLPGRANGPAYARNRGFEVSRGDIIVFIDADVVVHPNTLRGFVNALEQDPAVGAVFGSYDDKPAAPGLVSQYRNLLHHCTHQRNAGEAETFWAGAGAIRREVFEESGMYDEWHYATPQIEDIELGARIRQSGHRIVLRPEIQVTHLKKWTLLGVLRTDLRDRGIPWARLLAHRGSMLSTGTLNLQWKEKANTILVWLALMFLIAAPIFRQLELVYVALACLVLTIFLSWPLWSFFARVRGVFFTLGVIPIHLLYYLLNGVSFGLGLFLHQLIGAPTQDPTIEAYAEVGVKRWPPVPSRERRSSWTAES